MRYVIHGMIDSGNCWKPRLLCHLLGLSFEHREVSTRDGSTRTPEFLARNPAGQCPILELPDGRVLPESDAILAYLADGTPFLPEERFARARTLGWMFFEQNAHEVSVAVRRALTIYPERGAQATPERMALLLRNGEAALATMERHLVTVPFFGGERPTVADVALYPYTATAHEGGFDLAAFPAVRRWLERIRSLPGYQPREVV